MMTSTFDKIYSNAQNMNIETSEWFNRAGFFWCQCTEKQLQKMRLLLRAQGCKTIRVERGSRWVMKSRISKEGQIMKLLDLLNVIEDDTPIWIYIDHPFPCKKEGLFFGAVQFAAENDSEWEGYRVVLTFPELYEPLGGVVGMSIVVVKEEP